MTLYMSSDPKQLNILTTREVIRSFGDLPKAMAKLDYLIRDISIDYKVGETLDELPSPSRTKKLSQITTLQNTLERGATKVIPSFLKQHVSFYESALLVFKVHGVFIPPSTIGVMFDSMLTHLTSDFEQTTTADHGYNLTVERYFNTLLKEVSIVLAARKLGIPVFGSCHGAQLLWYMHGGELYSLPRYYKLTYKAFSIHEGCIQNPNHGDGSRYETKLDTQYYEEDGYDSDPDEEQDKEYDHNLLMVSFKNDWHKFNAKTHPIMPQINTFFTPDKETNSLNLSPPSLPKDKIIARSFEYPGCIATQWHPHAHINTKSSRHYLHQFATQCLEYKASILEPKTQPSLCYIM